jgi:hypothetical protein
MSVNGKLVIVWPVIPNEHGEDMLWYASWIVGDDGSEGAAVYSGRGGERVTYDIPPGVRGLRIRRWVHEGLEPEYVDVLEVLARPELHPEALNFDAPQPYSRLPVWRDRLWADHEDIKELPKGGNHDHGHA